MTASLAGPLVVVAAAAVIIALERRLPYRPGQPLLREGFWRDLLLYALVQSYVLGWVINHVIAAVDRLVNQTIEFAPMLLLGATPSIVAAKLVIDSVWGMYIHSNIDVRPGWWSRVLTGPELHRWHHATDVTDVNFATKLPAAASLRLPGFAP